MTIYPVVMCGGSGTRLWPASTRARPKQFAPLCGPSSSFQSTIARVAGITGAGRPIVVAGVRHKDIITRELEAIGAEATILLEPEARDSAAAMAAAAAWIVQSDPEGVAVFVSADHEIPDSASFQAAIATAVEDARGGRIVTLGVKPTFPSTAFGYIRPAEGGEPVRAVAQFVEKPDEARARAYVDSGYLWNSGNFVVAARVLLAELEAHAPQIAEAAVRAAANATTAEGATVLGEAFRTAPKTSIDYAVMERTTRAAVAPVSFSWADIGSWDAVLKIAEKDERANSAPASALLIDSQGCLVRAPSDHKVAVIGARDLAVVVHEGSVLVCDLAQSQKVKTAGDHFGGVRPAQRFADAAEAKAGLGAWFDRSALPLWWALGADHAAGGFVESLDAALQPVEPFRRARVAARQTVVYAGAGADGWRGPWKAAAEHGLTALRRDFRRNDGLYRTKVSSRGEVIDDEAYLYDQAFVLLALATSQGAGLGDHEPEALELAGRLDAFRHPAGGFTEAGAAKWQSNAHMHLLEASLAWIGAGASPLWRALADEIVELAKTRFIDAKGVLREFFQADWSPAPGDAGRRVEPGHQFEWAWLLDQYRKHGGRHGVDAAIDNLFEAGLAGFDAARGVVVDALDEMLAVMDGSARLWPQTEFLRAAVMMRRPELVAQAANALAPYLDDPAPGLWRDALGVDATFQPGPAPASSLYHLSGACRALCEAAWIP